MGATFALTEAVVANKREKDDALNGAAGACAAGFLAGIRGVFYGSCYVTNLTMCRSPILTNGSCLLRCFRRSDGYL